MAHRIGTIMGISTKGQIRKGIQRLKKTNHYDDTSLSRVEELLDFSLEVKRAAKKNIKTDKVFVKDIAGSLARGKQLADFSKIEIDHNFILDKFDRICEIHSTFGGDTKRQMDRLKEGLASGKLDFAEIQKYIARRNMRYFASLAKKVGMKKDLFYSTCLAIYRPLFELCAEEEDIKLGDYAWKKGSCPLCGTAAGMARFEEEVGRRILWCPLCGTEWVFKRLQCPSCGNEDQKTLRYFFVENEKTPYRVDVCDRCKHYVKTVDERKQEKGQKTFFEIENMMTLYLDDCAKKEGFRTN